MLQICINMQNEVMKCEFSNITGGKLLQGLKYILEVNNYV